MSNGYFNKQTSPNQKTGGKGLDGTGFLADTPAIDRAQRAVPKMNVKPGFGLPGLPGKAQPRDRSGGVTRAQVCPGEEGL